MYNKLSTLGVETSVRGRSGAARPETTSDHLGKFRDAVFEDVVFANSRCYLSPIFRFDLIWVTELL